MVDRVRRAFVRPVPSDTGLRPLHGPPPTRVATAVVAS